ncbi:MAG: purine-nucleoside phosphorylase [Oscillospiraceae bacterium]|nr:purine-nucleoside phosphorylase [Oscillospiraceae bacterium]
MSTEHNSARPGEIAKTVLMPGDPLRAKFFAETFLEDVHLFNSIRNMYGFTGKYKGKPVSIMGSGMGICSIGIYSYELFKFFDVDNIIRLGTCGCYKDENFELLDTVLVKDAFSLSTYAKEQSGFEGNVIPADPGLLDKLRASAKALGYPLPEGRTHSSDVIYYEKEQDERKVTRYRDEFGCDIIECECFALFHNARVTGKHAGGLMSIVDLETRDLHSTAEERERGNLRMCEIALEIL